jgi:hypothetical protein
MEFPNVIELHPFFRQYMMLIILSKQMYTIIRIKYKRKKLREAYKWNINSIDVHSIPISAGLYYI